MHDQTISSIHLSATSNFVQVALFLIQAYKARKTFLPAGLETALDPIACLGTMVRKEFVCLLVSLPQIHIERGSIPGVGQFFWTFVYESVSELKVIGLNSQLFTYKVWVYVYRSMCSLDHRSYYKTS